MTRRRGRRATALSLATAVLLALTGCDNPSSTTASTAELLPRDAIVSVGVVTQHFPEITNEGSTGQNETSVGKPIATRSVVFLSADGKKKVTLSVDQYANTSDAAAAFQTAVKGSEVAPGFKPAAAPDLGQEAFAGTSQVGSETHFGLGARDGALIVSATHAGDIPVTAENTSNLINLSKAELASAKQLLAAP
jgi:hypothetical protein